MFKRTRISTGPLLTLGGALLAPVAVQAQDAQRIEITGSSIRRVDAETALPVQIINREDIQRSGVTNVEQLIKTISATTSSQAYVSATASGATTLGLSGVSLRGLSSQRTLILINGKRVAPYGYGATNDSVSVDVNAIPISAIERVEVLKDGASAVYGSDAIAGVVNFILRQDYRGAELAVEYGQPKTRAGSTQRLSGVFGTGDLDRDRYNLMVTVNLQREKALFGRDRGFASSGINLENLNDTTSGNTFPANIFFDTGRLDGDGDPIFVTRNPSFPACPGPYAIRSPVFDLIGSQGCRFDPVPLVTLLPQTEKASIFAAGKLRITPDTEAYAELSFAQNKQNVVVQPTPISDQFALPPNNALFNVAPYNGFSTIVLQPSSPHYPTALVQAETGGATPDLLVRWRAAALGDRDLTDTSKASRLNLGVHGFAANWDYDAGFLYSDSKVSERTNNGYVIQTQVLPILNSGQVNFFGPNTLAVQAQLDATQFRGEALAAKTSLASLYAKGSRELMKIGGGHLAVAVGGEYRKEKYALNPATEILSGDLTGYGGNFLPVDASRDVKALFAELNAPILRNVEANFALRHDDYEGVGSKTTPKASLRWRPTQQVLLRAVVGQGFRAPGLLDLKAPQTIGVSIPGLSDPLRCPTTGGNNDCNTQFARLYGGNPTLKPEQSTNTTIGIVLEPTPNLSASFDYFNIKLKETITAGVVETTILSDLTQYGHLVTRGPVDPAFPNLPGPIIQIDQTNINLGRTNLSGVDLDLRYRFAAGNWGKFTAGLTGTYFIKYETQNPDGSFTGQVDQVDTVTGGVLPRWKHHLSVNWSRGPWSVTATQNYQGGYHDIDGTFVDRTDPAFTIPRRDVKAYVTHDLQASYEGFKNLTITGGIRNILDEDPPYTNAGGQVWFQGGYDPGYADPRGRFFYAKLNYKFF
jgi:iron complex outermembrane recepter protein